MKIVYIANIRIPTEKAHSIQIMKMCEAFDSQGIEVELIIPTRRNNLGESKIFEYYGIKKPFKVKKIPSTDLLGGTMSFGRVFYWIDLITFLFSLYFLLRFEKGSVIYSRDPILLLPFSRRDYKLLMEIHSLPARHFSFLKLLSRATLVITITKYLKNLLIENGFSENKVIVASDAVDIEAFDITISQREARRKLCLPEDKILIGYVGMLKTMNMEKGIDTILKSLKFIASDVMLVLVGGHQNDVRFYRELAKGLGITDKTIFVGRVAPTLVPIYLKAFNILVAPFPDNKHYRYYMSPLKLFEYMASGVPIIVSDLPSLKEIVNESMVNFFKPNDPKDLSFVITNIINYYDDALGKAKKSLENVQNYSWRKRAQNILNFIR